MVCPHWLSFILYNPLRKLSTDRHAVLRDSRVNSESVVMEIGAGNGFFTEVLAEHAQFVYAVELQEGMVRKLKRRLGRLADKVSIIRDTIAAYDGLEETVDVGFLYYAFHEVDDQDRAAGNIVKALKQGGILVIYEPTVEVSSRTMDKTVGMFERRGMVPEKRKDGLFSRFARLRKMKDN